MSKKEVKNMRRQFTRELFRDNKFNLFCTLLATMFASCGSLIIPWLIKEIVDLISGVGRYTITELLIITIFGIALFVLAGILDYIFLGRFRVKAITQYRSYAFERLMNKGIQAFSGENTSLYLSAFSNDVNTIESSYIAPIQNTIQTSVMFIGALFLMLRYSLLLTMVAIFFSFIPILVSIVLGNCAAIAEKKLSDKKALYTGVLKDALSGFSVIKSFRAEQDIIKIHDENIGFVKNASENKTRIGVLVSYSSMLAGIVVQLGVFIVAACLVNAGNSITPGVAIAFVQLMNYILNPIQILPSYYAGVKSSYALIDKIAIALDQNVVDEGTNIQSELRDSISIRNLSFSYEKDKEVLKEVNMKLNAGGCYAIVGGSGSGKSTILNLLMAASRDYQGEIKFDGIELRSIAPSSLYNLVSTIQQNVFVFNRNIVDNVTMFSEFTDEEIDHAIEMSGLGRLIEEKGKSYTCGENGVNLSGGERQRISIARALLRKTPVLLVDEATAALDAKTSYDVMNAILNLKGYTRVIVTHDLDESILKRCDGIFTMKNGKIAEKGSFEELMNQKGYFYSLFTVSQN
ncbi:ABC transporter ATP-binding protein [Butyrivibrio sp. NC3005]|uniref:ABC transporter ATP-binding protein n=1 Tax=Butyrivibrio sp. NC3005 TaxID=1280685 RepID=UPI000401B93F|nr:ABC transporter ATP-binding protein [Butyrivibrio sp. NC3005]